MYKLTDSDIIIRVNNANSTSYISPDPASTDYAAYLQWLAEGNTPEPYVAPVPPPPQSVTRFQALAALAQGGHLPAIRTYMATLDQDDIVRLAWENAASFDRSSTTLAAIAEVLGLNDEQVDALFITASKVSA